MFDKTSHGSKEFHAQGNRFERKPVKENKISEEDLRISKEERQRKLNFEQQKQKALEAERESIEKYESDLVNLENFIPDVKVKNYASGYFIEINGKALPAKHIESVETKRIAKNKPHMRHSGGPRFYEYLHIDQNDVSDDKCIYYPWVIIGGDSEIFITMSSGQKHSITCWNFQHEIMLEAIRYAWMHLKNPYKGVK